MEQRYTSNEVVALTGMTPRQLQWWDERGIVVPQREGRRRLYSLDDLAEVAVIGELRARGFSLQRVRKVMRFLQRETGKRLVETVGASSDCHLLTDGKHIYLKESASQVIDILKNSRQAMFAICLSDTVRQVRADLALSSARSGERNGMETKAAGGKRRRPSWSQRGGSARAGHEEPGSSFAWPKRERHKQAS